MTEATLIIVRAQLAAPVNFNSKGFKLLVRALEDLRKFHNGLARTYMDYIFAVFQRYRNTFPKSYEQHNKELMIKGVSFTIELYSINNGHVNNYLMESNVKLLNSLKSHTLN